MGVSDPVRGSRRFTQNVSRAVLYATTHSRAYAARAASTVGDPGAVRHRMLATIRVVLRRGPAGDMVRVGRASGSVLVVMALVVLAGCSSTAGSGSSAGSSAPSTSPAAPASVSATQPAAGIVYLALGDSNVYGDPGDCGNCTTYPHLLAARLRSATGKTVRLIDASQHNKLTSSALLSEIRTDNWNEGGSAYPMRTRLSPRAAIAAANLITITVGANMIPWYDDPDPCKHDYGTACVALIEKPVMTDLDHILGEIQKIRGGKPTAVRVTTFHNDLLKGPGYDPAIFTTSGSDAFSKAAIAQAGTTARTFLETWSHDMCATAKTHGARCLDIYHLVGGPRGDHPLPAGWYTAQHGDMNQAGQNFYARQLAKAGLAPLTIGG
jgi:lysophospholipase L1-like esterase